MLICEGCGFPIEEKDIEWVNRRGILGAYHTGARYDPTTCAYKARHQTENRDSEFYTTRLAQDEFMR